MRPTVEQIIEKIEGIRNVNKEPGFISLNFRENVVREEMNVLAEMVGSTSWAIRPAVLSARGAHEVAAELEALACVP